jgi:2-amino-4-hydroxy-6-hydroxymethyldihydropteridine diphosphokinase
LVVHREIFMTLWRRAFVGIGANKGEKENTIMASYRLMAGLPESRDFVASSLWHTSPVGVGPQEEFLNSVCSFLTPLSPQSLFRHLVQIERELGRTEKGQGSPRTIDLDLLLLGECHLQTPSLTLPHPRMLDRLFVLLPLLDLGFHDGCVEIPSSLGPQKVNINDHIQQLKETTDQQAEKFLSARALQHNDREESSLPLAIAHKEFVCRQ